MKAAAAVMSLALAANAAVALWIGFQDLFWPVSLSAGFIGLLYFTAGLISLAGLIFGVFPLLFRMPAHYDLADIELSSKAIAIKRLTGASHQPLSFVASASLAGLYIDSILVFYSFHYKIMYVRVFGLLFLLCACAACVTVPAIWRHISKGLKAAGISLAALGAVVQFWYQGVYVPENDPVGIESSLTIGNVARSGNDTFVQVNLTMEDAGSVPALALGSLIVISGISYPSGNSTTLDVLQPINKGSFLFPNEKYLLDFVVEDTKPVTALHAKLQVDFTRTSWVTLSDESTGKFSCPEGGQSEWEVSQSSLLRFTRGSEVLYSDWCAGSSPHIYVGILDVRGKRLVLPPNQGSIDSDLGILDSTRNETLIIG